MSETNVPIKREIFLHFPTIEILTDIVENHNFGYGWNDEQVSMWCTKLGDKPNEDGLFLYDYDLVYYRKRWLRKDKRYVLGRIRIHVEKSELARHIIHRVDVCANGLPTAFQHLVKRLKEYIGDRVTFCFITDEPRDW